jgi:D-3-phosphoglycerate dehydrogenase
VPSGSPERCRPCLLFRGGRALRPGVAKSKKEKGAQAQTRPEGDGRLGKARAERHGCFHPNRLLAPLQALAQRPAPLHHAAVKGRETQAMTFKVVVGRRLPDAGMAVLKARSDLDMQILHDPTEPEWHAAIADAEGCIAWTNRVDRAALAIAPRLRAVSRIGVGYDTVDITACSERGVAVMVANGSNDLSVAEHAMMLLLAVARRAVDIHNHVARDGGWWPADGLRMVDLAGRKALVVGYGRIGTRVAQYLKAFKLDVAVLDPNFAPHRIAADGFRCVRDLHAGLAEADVVTLHCPLMPATHHLMDEAAFAAMKPGAILVNTARGPVVKQDALVEALRSGHLMGAGLDVLEVEPAIAGNPLLTLPNVVISPHSAASTKEGLDRMAVFAAQNMLDALDGKPDPAMMVNPWILQKG